MMRETLFVAAALAAVSASEPARAGEVSGIVIDTDRSVNCATVETIAADVCRGCKTDQAKAVALYDFVVRTVWMPHVYGQPKEMVRGRLASVRDPLKVLNVYGAAGCDIQADVLCTLAAAAGLKARRLAPGFAHGSNEIGWDGKWHWMDVWLPCFLLNDKGEIYSYDELMADRSLIDKAVAAGRVSENFMYNPGPDIKAVKNAGKHGPGGDGSGVKKCVYFENLRLRPGESCTWLWDNIGKWYWPEEPYAFPAFKFHTSSNCKQAFPYWQPYAKVLKGGPHPWNNTHYRYYGNAVFEHDVPLTQAALAAWGAKVEKVAFAKDGGIAAPKDGAGTVVIPFQLPYVIADTEIRPAVSVAAGGAVAFEFSLDGGKTWKVAKQISAGEKLEAFSIGKPNSREYPAGTTSGQYAFVLKLTFRGRATLTGLTITNTTMLNFYTRPWLEAGKNNVTVAAAKGSDLARTPLEVTWKWVEDWHTQTPREKSFTHKAAASGAKCVIEAGGKQRPKMTSITIACPNR